MAKTQTLQRPKPTTSAPARRIFATFFMTLDGVVENPAWSVPYWNDEIRAFKAAETDRTSALLLGRTTYESFAKAWPSSKDEGADFFNNVRKYVVSTRRSQDIWKNATFLRGDLGKAIAQLKEESGGDLAVHGSITLARWLIKEGLLDELRLLVYSVVVGKGKRLFDEGMAAKLKLSSCQPTSNGVMALVYKPADGDKTRKGSR